jgi:hypothetical protein
MPHRSRTLGGIAIIIMDRPSGVKCITQERTDTVPLNPGSDIGSREPSEIQRKNHFSVWIHGSMAEPHQLTGVFEFQWDSMTGLKRM